jgi:NAD(P)-dependent dehydrogenase (short-subunit alcohol dehydrogenase family)
MRFFGRADVLINNAGIMRNGAFKNMSDADFRDVLEVHVSGTARLTREMFRQMILQGYGRILMTASAGGLYGAFGVANYAAAKLAQIGLMNVLAIEGARSDIRVNAIAPIARSRMLDGVVAPEQEARLTADWVVPAAVYLVSPACARSGDILVCGGGHYANALMVETDGVYLGRSEIPAAEGIASMYDRITDAGQTTPLADVHAAIRKALGEG